VEFSDDPRNPPWRNGMRSAFTRVDREYLELTGFD